MDREEDLADLKNLGSASVNILNALGMKTRQDLEELGSVKTYLKIRTRGIRVSRAMLYALEGALSDTHWKKLSPARKKQLLEEAETLEARAVHVTP